MLGGRHRHLVGANGSLMAFNFGALGEAPLFPGKLPGSTLQVRFLFVDACRASTRGLDQGGQVNAPFIQSPRLCQESQGGVDIRTSHFGGRPTKPHRTPTRLLPLGLVRVPPRLDVAREVVRVFDELVDRRPSGSKTRMLVLKRTKGGIESTEEIQCTAANTHDGPLSNTNARGRSVEILRFC